jgi:hypothetical protein
MWLLDTATLELKDFGNQNVPPYAILSHTWGSEEVSLQEMQGDRQNVIAKEGYNKIVSVCAVAARASFQYIWIDTCCIDKKSSAELSEAINSMFYWYKNAAICYAFLSDVSSPASGTDLRSQNSESSRWMKSEFEKSRWFTRGWTLQELIAPPNLDFYSKTWEKIGTQLELAEPVRRITGINVYQVQLGDLADFSVAQRMSWASKRNSTRVEDEAYCLLGIFGIHMPLLYGEGKQAFLRLQEEILKRSDDHSIFAWTGDLDPSSYDTGDIPDESFSPPVRARNLLANSASEFQEASNVVELKQFRTPPYSMTNQGLSITLPCISHEAGQLIAILNCGKQPELVPGRHLGIYLQDLSGSQDWGPYARILTNQTCVVGKAMLDDVQLRELVFPANPERWQVMDYFAELTFGEGRD